MTTIASVDATALAARLRLGVTRLARRLRQEAEAGDSPSMLSALSSAERQGSLTMRDLCHAEQVQPRDGEAEPGGESGGVDGRGRGHAPMILRNAN